MYAYPRAAVVSAQRGVGDADVTAETERSEVALIGETVRLNRAGRYTPLHSQAKGNAP